jgi:Dolichyl-phosphate-mannose-protein mannosyltransferase
MDAPATAKSQPDELRESLHSPGAEGVSGGAPSRGERARGSTSLVGSDRSRGWTGWRAVPIATLAIVLVGLVWRIVRYSLAFPLWGDEAFLAVNFLTRDLPGLARPLEFGQVAPPGFLWAEWVVVRAFGSSELALRFIPFVAGVASLGLFWRFCAQVTTRRVALIAVAIFAVSIYPVRHANEVKPYAVDLLIALSILSLGQAAWRNDRSVRAWAALTVLGFLSVWCSYTAVFVVAGVGILLFARAVSSRSPRSAAKAFAFAALSSMSWASMIFVFARGQLREAKWLTNLITWRESFPPLSEPGRIPLWMLRAHTGNMLAYPVGGANFASTGTFLLVLIGCVGVWARRPRRPLLWLLLGPLAAALVAAALQRYPYGTSARVTLYMAPAFCLLAAEGVATLLRSRRRVRIGAFAVAAALSLIPVGGLVQDLQGPTMGRGEIEIAQLVRRLANQTRDGDRWVVFDGATPLPDAPDLMTTIWVQRVAIFRFYIHSLARVPTSWEPNPGDLKPNADGRTWFLVHHHGSKESFPDARRRAYELAVRARLGAGRLSLHKVAQKSVIGVEIFEPRTSAVSVRESAARQSR